MSNILPILGEERPKIVNCGDYVMRNVQYEEKSRCQNSTSPRPSPALRL